MTQPPTPLTNGSQTFATGTSAAVSDAFGNLLFYTNGMVVKNKNHQNMANGTGLLGNGGGWQGVLIVKKPGSSQIYYIFHIDHNAELRYSMVDMTLASGNGSVTTKNVLLSTLFGYQITGTRHCNNNDIWVVSHNLLSSTFKSFLVTATGINTIAVVSNIGPAHMKDRGGLKISPDGKKIASATYDVAGSFEIYDFDNMTGIVSNSLMLLANLWTPNTVEFSPDNTKLYGGTDFNTYQWDLCSGTNSTIVNSINTFAVRSNFLQLALDGKIYGAHGYNWGGSDITVISKPNLIGTACDLNSTGLSVAPANYYFGLCNFINSYIKTPFSFSTSATCLTGSFSSNSYTSAPSTCTVAGPTVTSVSWDFGDPQSGAANSSTLLNPWHSYPSTGNYTVSLIRNSLCGADTVKQIISLPGPTASINYKTHTCNGLIQATLEIQSAFGPYTQTWVPSGLTATNVQLASGIYTVNIQGVPAGCYKTLTTNVNPAQLVTISVTPQTFVSCANNAIGVLPAGGGGGYTFSWTPGSFTSQSVSKPPPGIYTVVVTDNLHGCSATTTVLSNQWTNPTVSLTGNKFGCAGKNMTLTASGAQSYNWSLVTWVTPNSYYTSPISQSSVIVITPTSTCYYLLEGSNNYTLQGFPGIHKCYSGTSTTITVYPTPTLSVKGVSTTCAGQTTTLMASGADTFSWSMGGATPEILVSPTVSTIYTVTGTYNNPLMCSAEKTVEISVEECADLLRQSDQNEIIVYPNPANSDLFVLFNRRNSTEMYDATINIFDISGRILDSIRVDGATNHIKLTKLACGVYFVVINDKINLNHFVKFIVTRDQ